LRNPVFNTLTNSDLTNNNLENSTQNLQKLLKSTYSYNKVKFDEWLIGKKLSKKYIQGIKSVLENTLSLNFTNPLELKEELLKVKNRKYRALALRNLFNFCEEYELIDQELILKLKSKIKVTERSNIDTFIPSETEMQDFLSKVKTYDKIGFLFVKILLESGLRITEVQHFIRELNTNKFEVYDTLAIYPLYYLRGTKSSYYVFMTKEIYSEIIVNFSLLRTYNVEGLKTWIKRNELIPLKYTRKYNFTKLIRSGISFEVANFIQGRVSQNIGFNHYLAKKEVAVKEYEKLYKNSI
jgi:intergrase/recombinase